MFTDNFGRQENKTFIQQRYRLGNISHNLKEMEKDNIITQSKLFIFFLKTTKLDRKVKSGVYEINNQMSPFQILNMMLKGLEKKVSLTIIEGFDLYDIDDLMHKQHLIKHRNQFVEWAATTKAKKQILNPLIEVFPEWEKELMNLENIEGFIYPDTYLISLSQPLKELSLLAGRNFAKKMTPVIATSPHREIHYWISLFTIASLIETETIVETEKPIISSVIYNRLQKKMKLRFDPTVIYTLKKLNLYESNLKDGVINIKRSHFSLKSPYNTYAKKNLPPGPIASFTQKSLEAALKPAKTEYLFFVAKEKGNVKLGHHFSQTYEQHLRFVKKLLRQRYD